MQDEPSNSIHERSASPGYDAPASSQAEYDSNSGSSTPNRSSEPEFGEEELDAALLAALDDDDDGAHSDSDVSEGGDRRSRAISCRMVITSLLCAISSRLANFP